MADSATYTPETLQRRYAMAQALLADPKKPITHWAEGLNELAKGALGGYQMGNTERLEAKQRGDANAQVMAALGLGGPSASAPLSAGPPSAGPAPAAPTGGPAPAPQVLGAGGAPATPDAQGVYGADATMMPPPVGPAMAGGGPNAPRGIRNNNALNLEASPFTQGQPGFSGSDGRFGKFDTPENGLAAADKLLASYGARGINTIPGIINRWAPQSDGNNTANYAAFVAKQAGLDPAAPVDLSDPAVRAKIIPAMAQFENGKGATGGIGAIAAALNGGSSGAPTAAPAASAGAPPSPAVADVAKTLSAPAGAPAAPLAGPAGVGANPNAKAIAAVLTSPWIDPSVKQAVIAQSSPSFGFQTLPDGTIIRTNPKTGQVEPIYQAPTKPQFTQIGEDMLGNKKFGFVDPTKRTVTDVGGQPIGGPGASSTTGNIPNGPDGNPLQGQELLKYLEKTDPMAASGVKGIIAGDLNMGGRSLQKLGPLAELVDPTMKQFDYQSRAKTRTDYTSGSSAKEITAINTAIGHADQLAGVSPKLGGTDYAPGILNPITQSIKRNIGDTGFQDAKRDWDTKSETLSTEVSKALNGGVPHVADKEHWRGILSAASSPTERASALKSIMGVLESRLHAKAQAYSQGMGTTREPFSFLNPENEGKYQRLLATGGAEAKPESATAPTAAAPAAAVPKAPAAGEVRSGYRFKGGDPANKANWEQVI